MVREYSPRLKLFMLILSLIGIIACFYVPAVSMNITAKLYTGTASPYNIDWMGTSTFKEILVEKGYKVIVVDEWSRLYTCIKKGDLVVIIAPDRPLTISESVYLYNLVLNGTIDLLVADENTTSNNLLRLFGLNITGYAVLVESLASSEKTSSSPFPRTVMYPSTSGVVYAVIDYRVYSENNTVFILKKLYPVRTTGKKYVFRLNWASDIEFTTPALVNTSSPAYNTYLLNITYCITGYTRGFLDYNDNGVIDISEAPSFNTRYTSVWAIVNNRSRVIVFSDSFLFTNQALEMNNTVYREYIEDLIDSINASSRRILILNNIYSITKKSIGIPYHPSIILYFLASILVSVNNVITSLVSKNTFFALIYSSSLVVTLSLMLVYMTSYKRFVEQSVSSVDETRIITETIVRKSVLEGKGDPRETINGLWSILEYSTRKLLGYSIADVARDTSLVKKFSRDTGIEPRKLEKIVRWLYSIYLKSLGKRRFPIVLSWSRVLKKYINYSEYILEHMGYTLTRKKGYRGIEAILH